MLYLVSVTNSDKERVISRVFVPEYKAVNFLHNVAEAFGGKLFQAKDTYLIEYDDGTFDDRVFKIINCSDE